MSEYPVRFRENESSRQNIRDHLAACASRYHSPLDERVDLSAYADKLFERALRFEAWSEGALVGLVAVYMDHSSLEVYVSNVSVVEAFTGRGIGTALVERCLALARKQGFRLARLEVARDDVGVNSWYTGLGFRPSSEREGSVMMTLALQGG